MIKIRALLTLLFISTFCFAQESMKDYYYSLGTEKSTKVYKYVEINNPELVVYKKITKIPEKSLIITESYSAHFWCYNRINEKLNEIGSEMISYINYFENGKGDTLQLNGTVVEQDVYKWNDDNQYKYSVEYINPNNGNERLSVGRIKINFTNITIDRTEYESVKYLDQYQVKSLDYSNTQAFFVDSYFAKGIGLVKFKENFFDFSNEFELDEILTVKSFNKLLRNSYK